MAHYALAVDIGGTFTDAVLRSADGRTWVDKTLTTPESLDVGFFRAVDDVLRKADIAPADVTDVVVHATTVVTNAVIERKGPRTALLVTEGFRDILTIRDEHRYEMFDPQIEFPQPLVPRELTFGISESGARDRRGGDAARCRAGAGGRRGARAPGCGRGRRLVPQCLSQSGERAGDARDHPRPRASHARLHLVGRGAADQGISAHVHGGDERLYDADHRTVSRGAAARPEGTRLPQRSA